MQLAGQAPRINQLFHRFPAGIQQVIPGREALLEGREGLLVSPFPGMAGQDDVNQLVGRVRLVPQVRRAVKGG